MEPYRVPFLFDRSHAPVYRLVNIGSERLRGVSMTLTGTGVMLAAPPRTLGPSESMEFTIRGADLQRDSALVIHWLRPTDDNYLWRVTF